MSTASDIETSIDAVLQECGVAYVARYMGEKTRDKWECDEWQITFKKKTTNPPHAGACHLPDVVESFEFFTGLGFRSKPKPFIAEMLRREYGKHAERSKEWRDACKPQAPKAASVLHSLILDSSAATMTFKDWCDTYGYDTDSIKALAMYKACQESADKLHRLFSGAILAKIDELIREY